MERLKGRVERGKKRTLVIISKATSCANLTDYPLKTDETDRLCRLKLAFHDVGLRQGLCGDAQVFDEHRKRRMISPVRAIDCGDAQWLRAGR